ncbi:MAG TPA: YceI family protein [Myxococcales bacterium]|jgi:polyisoprenoid-binding protein YceI
MLLAAFLALASSWTVDPARSTLRYAVTHKLHQVDATSKEIEGKAVVRGDSVLTEVRAQVASFHSGDGNRDEHMDEVMSIGTYPYVVVKGVARLRDGQLPAGPLQMTAQVDLHGVKKTYEVPVSVAPQSDGSLRVTAKIDVSLDAHHVERPSLLFVKIDDDCRIDVDLVLREQKQ